MAEKKWIDLHAHTCCSDGSLAPADLVELAARKGLAAVAVTDHDTCDGVGEALAAGKRLGVEVVPGIELSVMENGFDVHMVGLFVNPQDAGMRAALTEIVWRRRLRNERIAEKMISLGLPVSKKDFADLGTGVLTRGNLAQLLVDKGAASSVKEAMERYLLRGRPAYVPKEALTPKEAVEVIHGAGGLAFVAHFYQIDKKSLEHSAEICRSIIKAGADGLETLYSEYDENMQNIAEGIAEELGCLRSGGSDFHGRLKLSLELGTGYEDLRIPYEYLAKMKEFLGNKK